MRGRFSVSSSSSPLPRTFSIVAGAFAKSDCARSDSSVTSPPDSNAASRSLDVHNRAPAGPHWLWKPRLGMRRIKRHPAAFEHRWATAQPASWPWPLCPRPEVLPCPEPMPRPTRMRFLCLWMPRCTSFIFIAEKLLASARTSCLGAASCFSASIVALTELIGFVEPKLLVSMS